MVPHTQMMVCQHREQRKKINKEKKRKPKYIHPLSQIAQTIKERSHDHVGQSFLNTS